MVGSAYAHGANYANGADCFARHWRNSRHLRLKSSLSEFDEKLGLTAINAGNYCPVPDRFTTCGLFTALSVKVNVPLTPPDRVG